MNNFFKYYDRSKYRKLLTVNAGRNRIVEDFAQVSEDKLAVMYRQKVSIYCIATGAELMSKELFKSTDNCELIKLDCIQNKFVLVLLSDAIRKKKVYKLLVIDLNDLTSKEMNLDAKFLSFAYLESGYLVLGGEILNSNFTSCGSSPHRSGVQLL